MKKILFYFFIILIVSCKEKRRNFYGIGEIKLDSTFKNLPSAKLFTKQSNEEYKIDSFKLTNEIGFVNNLIVKTDDEKIYDVSFDCNKMTNISSLDNLMKNFEKYNLVQNIENKSLPVQFYQLSDGNLIFSKAITKKDSTISFKYCDIKKLLKHAE